MKSRNVFLIVIVVILVIGFFTKPGAEEFKEYIRDKSAVPPVIKYTNGFVYSVFEVTYYNSSTDKTAIASEKVTYMGLFGRFWKL